MASRGTYPVVGCGAGFVLVPLRFFPNSDNDPSFDDAGGAVSSVTYTEAGEWEVTFRDSYARLLAAVPGLQENDDDTDLYPQVGSYDASARTLTVRAMTGTTQTTPTANANASIFLLCLFQDTNVTQ